VAQVGFGGLCSPFSIFLLEGLRTHTLTLTLTLPDPQKQLPVKLSGPLGGPGWLWWPLQPFFHFSPGRVKNPYPNPNPNVDWIECNHCHEDVCHTCTRECDSCFEEICKKNSAGDCEGDREEEIRIGFRGH
jgi:hypothetical protein